MEFGHAYCQCMVTRTLCKFICICLRFIVFTMDFRILNWFCGILKSEKGFLRIGKPVNICEQVGLTIARGGAGRESHR
jgi:hypothetical protein